MKKRHCRIVVIVVTNNINGNLGSSRKPFKPNSNTNSCNYDSSLRLVNDSCPGLRIQNSKGQRK